MQRVITIRCFASCIDSEMIFSELLPLLKEKHNPYGQAYNLGHSLIEQALITGALNLVLMSRLKPQNRYIEANIVIYCYNECSV